MTVPENAKSFVKGTLPSWFSVMLLAVVAFTAKRALSEFDDVRTQLQATTTLATLDNHRLEAVEHQTKTMDAGVMELRLSQRDIIAELKSINEKLVKR